MTLETLSRLSIQQLQAAYLSGSCDPVEVMELTLAQAAAVNPQINALYDLDADAALKAAVKARDRAC